jgi:group I intron endonuclease
MDRFGIIYKVINKINGKVYIGQTTVGLKNRRDKHIRDSNRGSNLIFHRALRKYGFDNFDWCVLEETGDINLLDSLEFDYINIYSSISDGYNMTTNTSCQSGEYNPNYGNNMSNESKGIISKHNKELYKDKSKHPWTNRRHSKESRKKMSRSWNYDKHFSDETRKKMSAAQTDRKHSEATKTKCSESKLGDKNPFYGQKLSKEHREKISVSNKGKNNSFYGKKHSAATREKMRLAWQRRKANESRSS